MALRYSRRYPLPTRYYPPEKEPGSKWRWGWPRQEPAGGQLSSSAVRSLANEVQALREQVQLQNQELDLYEEELLKQGAELGAARDLGRFLLFQHELLVDMFAMRVLDSEADAAAAASRGGSPVQG